MFQFKHNLWMYQDCAFILARWWFLWTETCRWTFCIHQYIQGDSGGICTTLGNDSMSNSKQKSSYEHGSDFERLRSYGHFLIPVHALMWTALMEPPGGCLHCKHYFCQLTASEWVSGNCNEQLAQFTTERQPVLWPAVTFSKTSFKHRSIQIKVNFTNLTLHLYFKCIMYYAGLLFSSVHCQ